jgi:hypothetical protein
MRRRAGDASCQLALPHRTGCERVWELLHLGVALLKQYKYNRTGCERVWELLLLISFI